jgi:tRNA 5-methylaminomethyl-2-thiouridine biosynthesis bifunctional protein
MFYDFPNKYRCCLKWSNKLNKTYDTIVVGAGIVGTIVAYQLTKRGVDVLLVDRSKAVASGGSGAAGAFVSPKIGKNSPLQQLTNQAYEYAIDFYKQNFPTYFSQTGIIRIPKDDTDATKFEQYAKSNIKDFEWIDKDALKNLGIKQTNRSFYFSQAGVCDAQKMCQDVASKVEFRQFNVSNLYREGEVWCLQDSLNQTLKATNVILATGYENALLDMRYMGVRGTWGSRGDYYSKLDLRVSMHKSISISANIDGIIKLGATHNKAKEPCVVCDGKPLKSLELQAKEMIDSSDLVLKETFCGMRAGSKDYFPLVGRIIDVEYMFDNYPNITKGAKPPLKHHTNIYVLNGVGGRGFVFAPFISYILAEHITNQSPIPPHLDPDRLFLKWCRKLLLSQ